MNSFMPECTPSMSLKPGRAEKASVAFSLLLSTGAFMNLGLADANGQPDFVVRLLWYISYLVMAGLFFRKSPQLRRLTAIGPLVAVVAFALVSSLWSQDPGLTFRHSIDLAFALLFGVYFASRYELGEQLRVLVWVFGICVVFSLIFGLLGLGIASDAEKNVPGWYGIFIQKNNLGRVMVLSALAFLFWGQAEPRRKKLAILGVVASLVLILLSRSLTSTIVLVLVLLVILYMRWILRKNARSAILGLVFLLTSGLGASIYLITHLEQVTGLFGKSPTLTGRLDIWILCVVMALRQPWLGYGYEAFWLPDKWYVERAWKVLGWNAPSAHNGFLQLWLELGVLGMSLFLLAFCYYIVKALRHLREDCRPAAAWPLALLLFLLFVDLTEPVFLGSNSIFFILYVTAAFWLSADRFQLTNGPALN